MLSDKLSLRMKLREILPIYWGENCLIISLPLPKPTVSKVFIHIESRSIGWPNWSGKQLDLCLWSSYCPYLFILARILLFDSTWRRFLIQVISSVVYLNPFSLNRARFLATISWNQNLSKILHDFLISWTTVFWNFMKFLTFGELVVSSWSG